MKLFFETAVQKNVFLLTLPVGFLVCFLLDTQIPSILIQTFLDFGVLISTGVILVLLVLFSDGSTLRIYHLLGLISGAILYVCGVGICRRKVKLWYRQRKAGINISRAEMNTRRMEKG